MYGLSSHLHLHSCHAREARLEVLIRPRCYGFSSFWSHILFKWGFLSFSLGSLIIAKYTLISYMIWGDYIVFLIHWSLFYLTIRVNCVNNHIRTLEFKFLWIFDVLLEFLWEFKSAKETDTLCLSVTWYALKRAKSESTIAWAKWGLSEPSQRAHLDPL